MHARLQFASLAVAVLAVLAPLAVASPAEAASHRTWTRLAHCESGGRWHINTHNGYYGGLQFSRRTWWGYGGRRYSRWPHRATRVQQVRVAERVRRHQGWRAWPVCSNRVGLR